jgi:hypothetical protein
MLKEVNKKYANVTRDVLNLFKEMCEECQLKKRFFSIEYLYMSLIRAHTVLKLQEKNPHLLL